MKLYNLVYFFLLNFFSLSSFARIFHSNSIFRRFTLIP